LTTSNTLDRLGYAEAFFSLSDFEGFGEISHGKKKLKKGTPLLEFQNLDFSYPEKQDEKVLENISFRNRARRKSCIFWR
jgi:ABC-type multidrug transport system fused ATPase/permease subunit